MPSPPRTTRPSMIIGRIRKSASNFWRGVTRAGMQATPYPGPTSAPCKMRPDGKLPALSAAVPATALSPRKHRVLHHGEFYRQMISTAISACAISHERVVGLLRRRPGHVDPDGVDANTTCRANIHRQGQLFDVLPSLNIAYDINEEWVLRAAARRLFPGRTMRICFNITI